MQADGTTAPSRHLLPLVAWGVSLVAAVVLFTLLGNGQLAAPPLTDPGAWGDWLGDRDPVVATVAVLRLLVLAMAWYLVGVTTIGAIARLADIAALVRVADALSIPAVRRLLQSTLGVGLATAVVSSAIGPAVVAQGPPDGSGGGSHVTVTTAAALEEDPTGQAPFMQALADPADDAPAMHALDDQADDDHADDAPAMQALPGDTGDAPRMQVLAEDGPPPPGMQPLPEVVDMPTGTEDPRPAAPAPQPAQPAVAEHTVVSGDHLWSIAEAHLLRTLGDAPSEDRVAAYWQRLIEANRDRLVDRDNPDLILPGQQLVLPDVEAAT